MPVGNITPIHQLSGQTNTGGGTKDHDKLINRDAKDQHPIKSITGLEDALKDLESKIDGGGKAVKKEQERAEAAEQALSEQINAEKARAEEAEEIIEGNAKEYTDTKVNELSEDVDGRLKALNEQINAEIIPQIEAVEAELPPIKTDITNINNNIDLINRKIDDISIEELSKRKIIKVYEEVIDDQWVLAETFNQDLVYYEIVTEDEKSYYKRIKLTEQTFIPDTYYYYDETGINKTEDEVAPARNLLRTNLVHSVSNIEQEKAEGYYPAYEYDENETYYEYTYDSNKNDLIGIWQWNDDLVPAYLPKEGESVPEGRTHYWLINWVSFDWYNEAGRLIQDRGISILGWNYIVGVYPPYLYRRFRAEPWGVLVGTWPAPVGIGYGTTSGGVTPMGISFHAAALYPKDSLVENWGDSDLSDELGVYTTIDKYRAFLASLVAPGDHTHTYWQDEGMKKIWIKDLGNGAGCTDLLQYLNQNGEKLSDELLPPEITNYKMTYKKVEMTPEKFKSGKYFTYFKAPSEVEPVQTKKMILSKTFVPNTAYFKVVSTDKITNRPIYKEVILTESEFYANYTEDYYKILVQENRVEEELIPRIQLDENESIYRDQHGNNTLQITDNDIVVNGYKLTPDLKIRSESNLRLEIKDNSEVSFANEIENLAIEIPSIVKHGFCSYLTFETGTKTPNIIWKNKSTKPLKFIMSGATVKQDELEFASDSQYNIMFLCNGIYLEVYIQEIQLLG